MNAPRTTDATARRGRTRTLLATVVAAAVAALGLAAAPAASAHSHATAHPAVLGDRSLAAVLAKDGSGYDHDWDDFDILDNAVHAVLAAKPTSAVGVLADGSQPLTAFLPTDRAFRRLAHDVTGTWYGTEAEVFAAVASLGIDTVEAVLLYHVVPGVRITAAKAVRSDGAVLTTALTGATVTVDVQRRAHQIRLVDADPDDLNPALIPSGLDINKGNQQIAHAISRVLRPANL